MLLELAQGFFASFKHMLKPKVTVNFPEETRPQPSFFRGRHRLQRYDNGLERCVGCALCAAVCPSEAIYLEAAENDPKNPTSPGERYAEIYQIHLLRCIYCGFCEEACPEDAIVMGPEFRLADDRRDKFVMNKEDFLDDSSLGFGSSDEYVLTRSRVDATDESRKAALAGAGAH